MLEIITNIPLFVWPLFTILLISGIRASKPDTVPLTFLLLIPSVFLVWSIYSFFGKYSDPISIMLWVMCLAVGFFIGFLHMQKLGLKFDMQKRKIEMPGSWIPLILSMSIFATKFSIGMMGAMFPHLNSTILFLCLELFATTTFGIFAGRGVNCLFRYRAVIS